MGMYFSALKLRRKMSCEKLIEEKTSRIQNHSNMKGLNNDLKKWLNVLKLYLFVISLLLLNSQINGNWWSLVDYIWPKRNALEFNTDVQSLPKIPFEIGERDERFILEASRVLGSKLSDLDFCQQKIIISLRNSCNALNDEQVGKLAVLLMNCQLQVEGQKPYECTEKMSLAECTSTMSVELLQRYHSFENRAKTVCLVVRQDQFRALAEITVNNLVKSAQENVNLMSGLKENQNVLQQSIASSMSEITNGNTKWAEQQETLLNLVEKLRLHADHNLQVTFRQSDLLKAGHSEVAAMIADLRTEIHNGLTDFRSKNEEARDVYDALLNDISDLHGATEKIAARLDQASRLILEQSQLTKNEFKETVSQLREVNDIVLNLSEIIKDFRDDYKEKLKWLRIQLGGSEEHVIKHLSAVVIHVGYLLLGMLCLIFVNADMITRIFFLSTVALNLIAVLYSLLPLDIVLLTETVAVILATKQAYILLQKHNLIKYFEMSSNSKNAEKKSSPRILNGDVNTSSDQTESLQDGRLDTAIVRNRLKFEANTANNGDVAEHDGSESARNIGVVSARRTLSSVPSYIHQISNGEDQQFSDRSRSSTPFSNHSSSNIVANNGRCRALTARGTQCQLTAITSFCRIHDRPSYERQV